MLSQLRLSAKSGIRLLSTASPPAALVKELRVLSGSAPLLACRNALSETSVEGTFDVTLALKHLRSTQTSKTKSKTSGRVMSEGAITFTKSGFGGASGLALTCETDFAAKSETFVNFSIDLLGNLKEKVEKADGFKNLELHTGNEIIDNNAHLKKIWDEALLGVRENMSVRGAFSVTGDSYFCSYVHNKLGGDESSDVGKVGAVVELKGSVDVEKLEEVGKKLAMHVVAVSPKYLSIDDIPEEVMEEEKSILAKQLEDDKKPADIKEKMMKGRLNKWASQICLLEQEHVADADGGAVKKVLKREKISCEGFVLL
ncbi:hypothetical protein TrVE_jg14187 [Triparma verrucosa]|uniref:Elongation factor Ts, mitochondrial n=1 Tax=Triparma verrucosa TaxID=1606542 RepID=A0A9W7KSN3_9STRA|nr:hypothetical protein TrVE_jg14187 [Triparma verrucosa]